MKLASYYNILFPLRIRLYVGLGLWDYTDWILFFQDGVGTLNPILGMV